MEHHVTVTECVTVLFVPHQSVFLSADGASVARGQVVQPQFFVSTSQTFRGGSWDSSGGDTVQQDAGAPSAVVPTGSTASIHRSTLKEEDYLSIVG